MGASPFSVKSSAAFLLQFDLTNTGVTYSNDNGCISCSLASKGALVQQMVTGTLQWKKTMINIVSSTSAFPGMTSK